MQQLSLFAAGRREPVQLAIDPHGDTVKGEIDETFTLPHPRLAWDRARIEVHRHDNGMWMWSSSYHVDQCGGGYRVGPKWGNFAESRADAIYFAACEIERRLTNGPRSKGSETAIVLKWVETIKDNPEAAKPN